MLTRLNYQEIDRLVKLAENLGIDHENIVITGEYYFTGNFIKNYKRFIPLSSNLKDVDYEIYEKEHGIFKAEKEYVVDILEKGRVYEEHLCKVNLKNIYINAQLNVYPMPYVGKEYLLGNIENFL